MFVMYISYSDYSSENIEPFFNIPLNLSTSLEHSLDDYVAEQLLTGDNLYQTDLYGPQEARKSVKFLVLPPILMIQLKRFQFNYARGVNEKILHHFEYPSQIDLAKWQISSSGPCMYDLYAVLVHQGIKAQSGHYYAYVNIDDCWYRFNDQQVSLASKLQVFDYNFGGQIQVFEFDSREFKVFNRKTISSSTAYMLVYVKQDLRQKLLETDPIYPKWLEQHEVNKQEEKQFLKNRKNFYHNIQLISWQTDILGTIADFLGLVPLNTQNLEIQTIHKISKSQRVEEWIKPYNQKNLGAYAYLTNFQKFEYQTLINMQHRKCNFHQLIREPSSPFSVIFFPAITSSESILYVIKLASCHLILSDEGQHDYEIKIKFHNFIEINRGCRNSELLLRLTQIYNEQGYNTRFYYEEKKDLTEIQNDNMLIKGPPIQRNILGIIIVEKIQQNLTDRFQNVIVNWYRDLKNFVQILIKSEDQKYMFSMHIDQNKSVESLRQYIFEQKINIEEEECPAPENIVLKGKPKKTSKNYIQIPTAASVKDLIKNCDKQNIIVFGFSKLKADQRINQVQIKFSFRYSDFSFSEPHHVILDRKSQNQSVNIYQQIADHDQIKQFKQKQHMEGIRILLFSKDKKVINDMVSDSGHVHGKGQIAQVLQKQKGVHLIVESYPRDKIQESVCPVLLHHRTNNDQKIGIPRYLEFERSKKLTEIYEEILDILNEEYYEWEQKKVKFNPMKCTIYAFVKDYNKGTYLADQQTLIQFDIEEQKQKQKEAEQEKLKSKLAKQKQKEKQKQKQKQKKRKESQNAIAQKEEQKLDQNGNGNKAQQYKPDYVIIEDDKTPDQLKNDIQAIVIESSDSQKLKIVATTQQTKNASLEAEQIRSPMMKQQQKGEQKLEKKVLKSWEKTIETAFPTAKAIRIVVHHLYLTKAQAIMKINIQ